MKAKKSLGQNFLKSAKAVREIVGAGEIVKGETVLEIGPGTGILTRALLDAGAHVVAVEKDRELVELLKGEFVKEIKSKKLELVEGDILTSPLAPLLGEGEGKAQYKLIANIPYYITGAIIRKFLDITNQPSMMVLLVQKEVAERIVSRDGKESILSVAVKAYGIPKIISKVPRGAFVPAPNVDSAVLQISNIKHFGTQAQEKRFFEILHAGFAHKRKKLVSNLKQTPSPTYPLVRGRSRTSEQSFVEKTEKILKENGFGINTRAEEVNVDIWKQFVK